MKAMILAAGYGKRLLPLTKDIPKPLLKIGNKTLIEHNINNLIESGFSDIVINVSHLSKLVEDHVKNKFPNNNILFSFEEKPLGTGGGVLKALNILGAEPFLLINSDIYHCISFTNFPKTTEAAHLIGVPNPDHNRNGDFSIKNENMVEVQDGLNELTWSGISLINPIIFNENVFDVESFNIWKGVLPKYINNGKVTAHKSSEFWIDVGTQDRLKLANTLHNEEN